MTPVLSAGESARNGVLDSLSLSLDSVPVQGSYKVAAASMQSPRFHYRPNLCRVF